jgi:hypothetical protein
VSTRTALVRAPAWRAASLWTLLLLLGWPQTRLQAQAETPKQITAVRLSEPVTVDGVLSEGVWQAAGSAEFRKRFPSGGQPSETTEVWVAYDDRALYVAVRCHDSDPARIARTIGPRDADLESDWFMVSIDTYRDGRTAYFFRVNPGGAIQDGILFDDVRSDLSWDGVWERAAALDSLGWTAEIRIPFSQLRFNSNAAQTWGINFTRRIQRTNEVVDFTAHPRGRRGNVSLFAELVGLQDLRSPLRLEVLPYLSAEAHAYQAEPNNPFLTGRDYGTNFGGDLKLGLGSGLTLDAAINPDFGHVEVDPAVVNLTPNETFYEEKRPLFLEGGHIFDFGRGRGMRFFHSRRIGRVPNGSTARQGYVETPNQTGILGAAKLTGRLGPAWTIGWLNAVTKREFAQVDVDGTRFFDEIEPLSYYGVVRAQHSAAEGSQGLGFFGSAALRDLGEESLQPIMNASAFAGGVDGWRHFGSRRRTSLTGWLGLTHITGSAEQMIRQQRASRRYFQRPDAPHVRVDSAATSLSGFAGQVAFNTRAGRVSTSATLRALSPGFELNDLGFNTRSDITAADISLRYNLNRRDDQFNRRVVGVSASREYDFGRTLLGTDYSVFTSLQLKNFWGGSARVSYSPEGLDVRNTRGGPAMLRPAGWSASAAIYSDARNPVRLSASGDASGDVAGSWSAGLGGDVSWLPSPRLTLSLGPWWGKYFNDAGYFTRVRDSTAAFTFGVRSVFAGLTQDYFSTDVRLNWTFTPGLSLQLYAQPYVTNIRYDGFKELARPGTYEFLVYGGPGSTLEEADGAYTVDPDGAGPAPPFTLYNSDFRYSSLRGTALLRWEYRRGSALIVAWTHDRFAYEDYWQDWRGSLLESHPDNRFLVKLTYWLSP